MMRAPVLEVPPSAEVVTLEDLKTHLRVDGDEDDDLIKGMAAAAVAHFDGWRGVLGRAIMPQTWSQEFETWGRHKLAYPEASNIVVAGSLEGAAVQPDSTKITVEVGGVFVEVTGGTVDLVKITYETGLAPEQLPAIRQAVMLLVAHWYNQREAVAIGTISTSVDFTIKALIAPLRTVTV